MSCDHKDCRCEETYVEAAPGTSTAEADGLKRRVVLESS